MRRTRLALTLACLSLALGCGGDDPVPDAAPEVDAAPVLGTFSLTWTVSNGVDVVACQDVGALTVQVQMVPAAGGGGFAEGFPCVDATGMSREIPVDTYNATLSLIGSGGGVLGDRLSRFNVEVTANTDTSLGQIDFVVPQAAR